MNEAIVVSGHISVESIQHRIYEVRGRQVMFDRDFAKLYEVETRVLNQVVRCGLNRFLENNMFTMTENELTDWKSQIVMSNYVKRKLQHSLRSIISSFD